jgi:transposase
MEACGSAHYWAREIGMLGHAVRLIPPAYVKPFVKRQKNNATDAEAICEAAQRPTMRFVAPKSEQTQAAALVFRARDLLVRQRTQVINALRGHLAEFGIVVAKGPAHVPQLVQAVENPDEPLPEIARPILQILIDTLHRLDEQIADLDREIVQRAKADETAHRLMTIPGIGPVTAVALTALAPPAQTFRRGRDFAAWMGLTPIGVKIALDPARVGTILGRCKTQHLSRRINLKSCCGDFPPLSILTASPDKPRRSSAGVRSTVALTCCAWRWPAALVACR